MLRPKFYLNTVGVTAQLWEGPFPHTVLTLWWRPLRFRVYFWRGKTLGNRPPEEIPKL